MDRYILIDTLGEAQHFMAGGDHPSDNLYFDSEKNVWFVPEKEYNSMFNS